MEICISDLLFAMATALDAVEKSLVGVSDGHGRRVAYIAVKAAQADGRYTDRQLTQLAGCAILHDNALTEYIQSELARKRDLESFPSGCDLGAHCSAGEKNISVLGFCKEMKNAVLYHHEEADGSGPFGKTAEETPFPAQLIHLADMIDVRFDLGTESAEKYAEIVKALEDGRGSEFSDEAVDLFLSAFPQERLAEMSSGDMRALLSSALPTIFSETDTEHIMGAAAMFARIIDYKSAFTCRHSTGIAEKAMQLGKWSGWDKETCEKLYLAGALHDVGKLYTSSLILEKPDKLTSEEFRAIQHHALASAELLSTIRGLEDVTSWAVNHHEKPDGSGYPHGKTAEELGEKERLMAAVDVYQALVEKRPYKDGMPHEKTVGIMKTLAENGKLDPYWVKAIDACFSPSAKQINA